MDHNKLLKMQKELDSEIQKAHNLFERNIILEKNLALLVEFSEFTNELAAFKYWKKNKNVDSELIYEEFADVLHFIYSFYIMKNVTEINNIVVNDINDGIRASLQFHKMASEIVNEDAIDINKLNDSFSILLSIAKFYNLDDKKIEDSYIKKNKINFDRIKNNY